MDELRKQQGKKKNESSRDNAIAALYLFASPRPMSAAALCTTLTFAVLQSDWLNDALQ